MPETKITSCFQLFILIFIFSLSSCGDKSEVTDADAFDDADIEEIPDNMVEIPAGEFIMGCNNDAIYPCMPDQRPERKVFLSAYKIDKFEVTVAEYMKCVKAKKCIKPNFDNGRCFIFSEGQWKLGTLPDQFREDGKPVVCIDWYQADEYCKWRGSSLPTEAQWEKAARGTDGNIYPWGDDDKGCDCAVVDEYNLSTESHKYGCGTASTWIAGSKSPGVSQYGVHDMAGNVFEWVNDWYEKDFYYASPDRNPQGPENGASRVVRGGSWISGSSDYNSISRNYGSPEDAGDNTLGFRCAVSVEKYIPREDFIQSKGENLEKNGETVILRGIALGNYVWQNVEDPSNHHDEKEYEAVASFNMNLVRFYLHYLTFEDDENPGVYKESGWQWIDKNIEWARKHGIYLILNVHVPQGGFQSMGGGYELWKDTSLQDRFVSMWKAIAQRYKDEPVIAAYDILNEPTVPEGMDVSAWQALAQRTVSAIREVDSSHIVVIEPLNGIEGVDSMKLEPEKRVFAIDDPQVMYDFHFYLPSDYTFQKMELLGTGDGGAYPDETHAIPPADAELEYFNYNNPSIDKGDSDWKLYEGSAWSTNDQSLGAAAPVIFCTDLTGTVKFDDLTVSEYDSDGNFIRELVADGFDSDYGWYSYTSTGTGDLIHDESDGMKSPGSLVIQNPGADSTAVWVPLFKAFPLTMKNRYVVSGAMKGSSVDENAICEVTLGAFRSVSGADFHVRDREYLKYELDRWSEFAHRQNAPLFVGEFGLTRFCFEDNKGGSEWLTDVLELLDEKGVDAASLHQYYDGYFGLYNDRSQPGTVNQPLIDTLKEYFLK